MDRQQVLDLVNLVLANSGSAPVHDEDVPLREAGFRSLDFSEVALRAEDILGRDLNFEAAAMRRIRTIRDVVDFFTEAAGADAL